MRRKKLLFLLLILGGLILTGASPPQKRTAINPKNKDVFIKGKLILEDKTIIRFWVEGDDGDYSLIIFEENSTENSQNFKNICDTVSCVFQKKVCSSLISNIFKSNNKTYFIIDFNNKEIIDKDVFQLFTLANIIAKDVQEKTNASKISGYPTGNIFN